MWVSDDVSRHCNQMSNLKFVFTRCCCEASWGNQARILPPMEMRDYYCEAILNHLPQTPTHLLTPSYSLSRRYKLSSQPVPSHVHLCACVFWKPLIKQDLFTVTDILNLPWALYVFVYFSSVLADQSTAPITMLQRWCMDNFYNMISAAETGVWVPFPLLLLTVILALLLVLPPLIILLL